MPNIQRVHTDFQGFGSSMFLQTKAIFVCQILWEQRIYAITISLSFTNEKTVDIISSIVIQESS